MKRALLITPAKGQPFIVDYDPSKESQEQVEQRYGVSYSEDFDNRLHVEPALNMRKSNWVLR
jgi:hypothetical protein